MSENSIKTRHKDFLRNFRFFWFYCSSSCKIFIVFQNQMFVWWISFMCFHCQISQKQQQLGKNLHHCKSSKLQEPKNTFESWAWSNWHIVKLSRCQRAWILLERMEKSHRSKNEKVFHWEHWLDKWSGKVCFWTEFDFLVI